MSEQSDAFQGGGILWPGVVVATNTTGQPERVLNPGELDGDES